MDSVDNSQGATRDVGRGDTRSACRHIGQDTWANEDVRANITYIHKGLNEHWKELSLREQMGNIGSEINRAIKWRDKKPERALGAAERALELFDLTIDDPDPENHPGKLKEICRAREEFCDFFYGENEFQTDPEKLMAYYNSFVM